MASASGVPPGSRVAMASMPDLANSSTRGATCVDFPRAFHALQGDESSPLFAGVHVSGIAPALRERLVI